MILNTAERKERTEDEVSDAEDPDCLCLRSGVHVCQAQLNARLNSLCTRVDGLHFRGPLNTGLK